jgi:hypothetical protein
MFGSAEPLSTLPRPNSRSKRACSCSIFSLFGPGLRILLIHCMLPVLGILCFCGHFGHNFRIRSPVLLAGMLDWCRIAPTARIRQSFSTPEFDTARQMLRRVSQSSLSRSASCWAIRIFFCWSSMASNSFCRAFRFLLRSMSAGLTGFAGPLSSTGLVDVWSGTAGAWQFESSPLDPRSVSAPVVVCPTSATLTAPFSSCLISVLMPCSSFSTLTPFVPRSCFSRGEPGGERVRSM